MDRYRLESEVINESEISEELIRQWECLSRSVKNVNPYLAPEFVLPAVKNLLVDQDVYFVTVWTTKGTRTLCGLGIFSCVSGDRRFPLPQLTAFKSIHSFLGGILLDHSDADNVLNCMLKALKKHFPWRFGVRLRCIDKDSWLGESLVSNKIKKGVKWFELDSAQRAVLLRKDLEEQETWDAHLSSKRRKNFKRALAKLEKEHGPAEWKLLKGQDAGEEQLDTFLRLENSGWKGEDSTSMSSDNNEVKFFKKMIRAFQAKSEVFFTELKVDGEVIASTCNLIFGRRGFAFKIGWNVNYRDYSPGVLNEVMFLNNLDALDFEEIDSGADESSFINSYWPAKKTLIDGVLTFGFLSGMVMSIVTVLRRMKQRMRDGDEKNYGK